MKNPPFLSQLGGRFQPASRMIVPDTLLVLWLVAFWFMSSATWHRILLGLLVTVSLALARSGAVADFMRNRWLWLAAALLGWQSLSRLWSGDGDAPQGWWLDSLLVGGLLVFLFGAVRRRMMEAVLLPGIAVVSCATSLVSLLDFYQGEGRNLADDRLRNVLFYSDGLNAVPTGFLFAFGALVAASLSAAQSNRSRRIQWAAVTAVSLFGLLASQSRGPILMFVIGFLVLAVFERRRILPTAFVMAGVTLAYFLLLLAHPWREAAADMIERGSTGRLDIYQWYLSQMSGRDFIIGTGMARPAEIPEEVLGWLVGHPHSIYLTQLFQTGAVGLAMLLALIGWSMRAAINLARSGECVWLCLLSGGCVVLLIDGGQAFTVYSDARVELLLVAVPAAIAMGKASSKEINGGNGEK